VPNPPGGGTDFVARAISSKMPEIIGESMVVDNRSGAAGLVGTMVAARALADGYTLLVVDNSFAINVSYYKDAKYNALKDFAPLTDAADTFYVLTVNPSLPIATVPEFIAMAKNQPGKIVLASPGNGTAAHLTTALIMLKTGIELTHVPYRGGGPAVADVVGGQVQSTFASGPNAVPLVKAGRLKALASTASKRHSMLADVPTFVELGFKDIVVTNWYGMVAIGGTPRPVLDKLHAAMVRIIGMPDVKERLASIGLDPAPMTQEAFRELIAAKPRAGPG